MIELTNVYMCTLLGRWTRGKPNRELKFEDRTPAHYCYAKNEPEAKAIFAKYLGTSDLELKLAVKGVKHVLQSFSAV